MSFTAVNPKVVSFGRNRVGLERDTLPIAASQTWKVGEFGIFSGGTLSVCASTEIPTHIFRTTRDTKVDDTNLEVDRLAKGVQLEMYCTGAVGIANVGLTYDLDVSTAHTHIVDLAASDDDVFKVVRLAATYEPERNATADDPGKCIVEIMKMV